MATLRASSQLRALACLVALAAGCSNFYMRFADYKLSVRTMDVGSDVKWKLFAFPRGAQVNFNGTAWKSKYGYVGFVNDPPTVPMLPYAAEYLVGEGLNERGLSCGFLSLTMARFPPLPSPLARINIPTPTLCKWVLENFATVEEAKDGLQHAHVFGQTELHFVIQDASGLSLVAEWLDEQVHLYEDPNDGVAGFGIMTNEPPFPWQLQNVQHMEWKRSLLRSAVAIPGGYYPDERFLRIHLLKQGLEAADWQPTTYQQAVAYAASVLNSITVPVGTIPGTDTDGVGGHGGGEGGQQDHTQFGVLRDHTDPTYFLRSEDNPTFRRIHLGSIDLTEGAVVREYSINGGPFFVEAAEVHNTLTVYS